jgi:tripartite-type tricarboxylate transporter receptor subunit TctC
VASALPLIRGENVLKSNEIGFCQIVHRRSVLRRSLLAAALSAPFISRAAAFPADRPIRLIVPGAPGGTVDVVARAIGDAMQRELGQGWLVDPRPGANGVIAARAFLEAPADDPLLYLTVLSHVLLPFLRKVPFDVFADFQPVALVGTMTHLLCVPARAPTDSVAGFVDYARGRPGKLNYLNPGDGTASHLLPEMLKIRFGFDITAVYYKAMPQGIADLVAGDLDLGLLASGFALPLVRQGRLKVIAQVSRHRLDGLPGVATLAEQGLDDLRVEPCLPLYGRTTLAASEAARLNRAVAAAVSDPTTRQRLAAAHIESTPMSPSDVGATLKREHDRLGAVIRQLGIKADGPKGTPS